MILKEQPSNLIYALYAGDGLGRPATDVFTTADIGLQRPDGAAAQHAGRTSPPPTTGRRSGCTSTASRWRRRRPPARSRSRPAPCASAATRSWTNEWFAGLIDEVRVYNKALTAAEIQADMTKPVN